MKKVLEKYSVESSRKSRFLLVGKIEFISVIRQGCCKQAFFLIIKFFGWHIVIFIVHTVDFLPFSLSCKRKWPRNIPFIMGCNFALNGLQTRMQQIGSLLGYK